MQNTFKSKFSHAFYKIMVEALMEYRKKHGNSKCDVLEPFICLLERKRNWELCIMNLSFEKGIFFV